MQKIKNRIIIDDKLTFEESLKLVINKYPQYTIPNNYQINKLSFFYNLKIWITNKDDNHTPLIYSPKENKIIQPTYNSKASLILFKL